MSEATTYGEKMAAVQEASTLVQLVLETSETSGPIPDAVSKVQMALQTLQAVLGEVAPKAEPVLIPPEPEDEPVAPPENTILP